MERSRVSNQGLRLLLVLVTVLTAAANAAGARVPRVAVDEPQGFVGDVCENGVCRVITDCPAAIAALQRREEPKICSYMNYTPIVCCPSDHKAISMCKKYAEAVYVTEKTWTIPIQTIKLPKCAIKSVPLIYGGEKAEFSEFPHMALIGYGNNRKAPIWKCGGSLISKRYVMTAAHCLQTRDGQPRWVRLGELNWANENEVERHIDFDVESHISHPDYIDGVYYNDIALLRLKQEVTLTPSIRPACLYSITEIRDKNLTASGWGYTNWENAEISQDLMKVKLPVQKTEVCQAAFRSLSTTARLRKGILEESMVCAGTTIGGKDTCGGDSGGPLQLKLSDPYCMYGIVGITSFGKNNCGTSKSPAVYTRVSHFLPWIEKVVWANDD